MGGELADARSSAGELKVLHERFVHRFATSEPRESALACMRGLISPRQHRRGTDTRAGPGPSSDQGLRPPSRPLPSRPRRRRRGYLDEAGSALLLVENLIHDVRSRGMSHQYSSDAIRASKLRGRRRSSLSGPSGRENGPPRLLHALRTAQAEEAAGRTPAERLFTARRRGAPDEDRAPGQAGQRYGPGRVRRSSSQRRPDRDSSAAEGTHLRQTSQARRPDVGRQMEGPSTTECSATTAPWQ